MKLKPPGLDSYFRTSVLAVSMLTICAVYQMAHSETPATPAPKAVIEKYDPKAPLPTDAELRKRLTALQYAVTRESNTERAFANEYYKTDAEGIYVDIISGKPLFSSKDKFQSDCGWPAFAKPISDSDLKKLSDKTLLAERVEVRSKDSDAHLGHVFTDGPVERGGLRYCINSASIRFVPKEKMAAAGYGDWLKLFDAAPEKKTEGGK